MRISARTNADIQMQEDLAAFGIMREHAKNETRGITPGFFGLQKTSSGYDTQFRDDPRDIDDGMTLAIVAPDNEPFDMLVKKDFKRAVRVSNPKSIRDYLSRLLDKL